MPSVVGSSEGRVGSGRIRSQGGRPVYEETYTYTVLAGSKNETRWDILGTSGLPRVNVTFSPGGLAVCRAINCTRRTENALYWDVVAEFSSEVEENGVDNPEGSNPDSWIPIYETKHERITEVRSKDVDGTPVLNSVGNPFETGLTVPRTIPYWELYQFEPSSVSDFTILGRNEIVNEGTFKGAEAKTLLCTVGSSMIGFYYGQRRRLTMYVVKYNKDKWTHKRLDVGTSYLDASGNEKAYKIKDLDGNLVQVLGPLDGDGGPAGGFDADDIPQADKDETAVLEFDIYPSNAFSFLRK